MKIRCIGKFDPRFGEAGNLTNGNVYEVLEESAEFYHIIGDNGQDGGWIKRRFELVDAGDSTQATTFGELDPSGISASTPGAKLDAGKLLPNLVIGEFSRALEAVARVGTKGARKYTARGWISVDNGEERYAEAAMRHQLKVWQGEDLDDGPGGTGELHEAQVIWNKLAALELRLRREERDRAKQA